MGKIFYMHDSSETTEDSFTLSASSYENNRRSHNVTISVSIIPVNDEPPKVTRNTGLEVKLLSLTPHKLLFFGIKAVERCLKRNVMENKKLLILFLP